MKILCTEYNSVGEAAIVPVGDDVLLRNNDDFYAPSFAVTLSAVPQLVVRLSKLGKFVSERFADRYFEEVGVGIRFYADSYEQELSEKGLPAIVASSFADSAAISALFDKTACGQMDYSMSVNGVSVFEGALGQQMLGLEKLISLASEYHTLKIGDFLYCGNRFRYRGLQPGDRLQMRFCGQLVMDFKVK